MDPNDAVAVLALFEAVDDEDAFFFVNMATEKLNPNSILNGDNVICRSVFTCTSDKQTLEPLYNHRINGFVSYDIPRYNDPTFKAHFRMERSTFESLLEEIMPDLKVRTQDVSSKVLSVVWLLSNEESYRSVADRFDMSKGSLHFSAIEIFRLLTKKANDFICWPDVASMQKNAQKAEERYGFPGVIGMMDGCHIPIKGKSEHRESYINRHGYSSTILQAVCDTDLVFLHTLVGWPGSVHDARVFRNSNLDELLLHVPNQYHLLGDSAYPLSLNVMTPYRDNGLLTAVQKKYNNIHSGARSCIERAFALLKGKFRRLKYLDMCLDEEIPNAVTACLVLHNFILKSEKKDGAQPVVGVSSSIPCSDASAKRNHIAASL